MPSVPPSFSMDTLVYMLMHSGLFVAVVGGVFFLIGLMFGRATWGAYKNKSSLQAAKIEQQQEEIAELRRELAGYLLKPAVECRAMERTIAEQDGKTTTIDVIAASPPLLADEPSAALPPSSPALPPEPFDDSMLHDSDSARELAAIVMEACALPEEVSTGSALAAIIAAQPASAEPKARNGGCTSLAADVEQLDVFPALPDLPAFEIKPELDPKLGLIYSRAPFRKDDLTAIKGIARVLEQRLHEFGIYTHDQIAGWTREQIKEFSFRLGFKDRIHREKWVEQAKKLRKSADNTADCLPHASALPDSH